jgi:RHH-type proline utilization regulon transcriptional repressor/proline dehydrogenase/delta 1-pyrroline-5-carboxylate dehydrogenase
VVGGTLTAHPLIAGVVFTGSTDTARLINRTLAEREGPIIPLIAETGGQNAMLVDSSALAEQVVSDVVASAFDSAGQRCSALRVLCVQADIADKTLDMLRGAMDELRIGNPDRLAVDIGPVIDEEAQRNLNAHIDRLKANARNVYQLPLRAEHQNGTFVAPTVLEIDSISQLQREVFGPVLHVIRYKREQLPQLIDAINASGYGLTLGIHSRIDETIDFVTARAHVGNIYVNRNIVGAVVGVQPFGGEGKSGTGPKAGGPLYLKRLQRNASVPRASHTIHAGKQSDARATVLADLLAWARTHGHERIAALGEQYAHASLVDTTMVLPGPTGERNTLSFAPRGNVLCEAADSGALLNQLAAVFATGNAACVTADAARAIPAGLPQSVRSAIGIIDRADYNDTELHLALVESSRANGTRTALAARDGALVPVVETTDDGIVPLWRLVAERALCVNTTAAGGNASLMTLGG